MAAMEASSATEAPPCDPLPFRGRGENHASSGDNGLLAEKTTTSDADAAELNSRIAEEPEFTSRAEELSRSEEPAETSVEAVEAEAEQHPPASSSSSAAVLRSPPSEVPALGISNLQTPAASPPARAVPKAPIATAVTAQGRAAQWKKALLGPTVERVEDFTAWLTKTGGALNEPNQRVIHADCERTRADMEYFRRPEIRGKMESMLTCWCQLQGVRYKQGLNEVLAPFLFLQTEPAGAAPGDDDVFACFSAFLKRFAPFFDSENFVPLQCGFVFFQRLLLYHQPDMFNFLSERQVSPEMFCTPWFLTLFASKTPLTILLQLWDRHLARNEPSFFVFLAVAVLSEGQKKIFSSERSSLPEMLTSLGLTSREALESCWSVADALHRSSPATFAARLRRNVLRRQPGTAGPDSAEQLLTRLEHERCFFILPEEVVGHCYPPKNVSSGAKAGDSTQAWHPSPLRSWRLLVLDLRQDKEFSAARLPAALRFDPFMCSAPLGPWAAGRRLLKGRAADAEGSSLDPAAVFESLKETLGEDWVCDREAHICLMGPSDQEGAALTRSLYEVFTLRLSLRHVSVASGGFDAAASCAQRQGFEIISEETCELAAGGGAWGSLGAGAASIAAASPLRRQKSEEVSSSSLPRFAGASPSAHPSPGGGPTSAAVSSSAPAPAAAASQGASSAGAAAPDRSEAAAVFGGVAQPPSVRKQAPPGAVTRSSSSGSGNDVDAEDSGRWSLSSAWSNLKKAAAKASAPSPSSSSNTTLGTFAPSSRSPAGAPSTLGVVQAQAARSSSRQSCPGNWAEDFDLATLPRRPRSELLTPGFHWSCVAVVVDRAGQPVVTEATAVGSPLTGCGCLLSLRGARLICAGGQQRGEDESEEESVVVFADFDVGRVQKVTSKKKAPDVLIFYFRSGDEEKSNGAPEETAAAAHSNSSNTPAMVLHFTKGSGDVAAFIKALRKGYGDPPPHTGAAAASEQKPAQPPEEQGERSSASPSAAVEGPPDEEEEREEERGQAAEAAAAAAGAEKACSLDADAALAPLLVVDREQAAAEGPQEEEAAAAEAAGAGNVCSLDADADPASLLVADREQESSSIDEQMQQKLASRRAALEAGDACDEDEAQPAPERPSPKRSIAGQEAAVAVTTEQEAKEKQLLVGGAVAAEALVGGTPANAAEVEAEAEASTEKTEAVGAASAAPAANGAVVDDL